VTRTSTCDLPSEAESGLKRMGPSSDEQMLTRAVQFIYDTCDTSSSVSSCSPVGEVRIREKSHSVDVSFPEAAL
jgi:hypothetical protein